MILVLADDLSGAAELAGIAFAHGLTAEVQTELQPRTEAQVICSGHRYATAGTGGGRGRAAEIDAPNQGGFAGIHFQNRLRIAGEHRGGAGRVAGDGSAGAGGICTG